MFPYARTPLALRGVARLVGLGLADVRACEL